LKPNARFRAEGCGGSRSQTQAESKAALDVVPGCSNFVQKKRLPAKTQSHKENNAFAYWSKASFDDKNSTQML